MMSIINPNIEIKLEEMFKFILIGIIIFGFSFGCAFSPSGIIYSDQTTSDTYPRPWTYSDVVLLKGDFTHVHATGRACASNILGIATGDNSYDAAIKDALKKADAENGVFYDVKIDKGFKTYLGLYSTFCTQVSGIAAKKKE